MTVTVILTENTVLITAISKTVFIKEDAMNKTYYDSIKLYLSTMHQAKILLDNGLISQKEYDNFDTITANKYGISSCSIFRKIA